MSSSLLEHFSSLTDPRQSWKVVYPLAKTDRLDALIIARYGQVMKPVPQLPKNATRVLLENMIRRRGQLVTMRQMEKQHLEHTDEQSRRSIDLVMDLLSSQITDIERQLKEIISSNPELSRQNEIITSVPGAGPILAATILASLPGLGEISRKQVAALIGVAPFNRDSGQKRGQRQVVGGRAKVREILYMAVVAALRFNPRIKTFYQKLVDSGKKAKVAIVACMRKMIITLNTMVKNDQKWIAQNFDVTA